jgi:hypothetical protein
MAGGRPTDYRDEFADQARKLCELGATDDELADFFETHRSTIYRWKHDHSEFCDAIKTGKVAADERVERSLYQKATGYEITEQQAIKVKVGGEEKVEVVDIHKHIPADTTAAIFWLKNRRKEDWRDKTESEINVFHHYDDMSEEELDRELEQVLAEGIVTAH